MALPFGVYTFKYGSLQLFGKKYFLPYKQRCIRQRAEQQQEVKFNMNTNVRNSKLVTLAQLGLLVAIELVMKAVGLEVFPSALFT